MHVKSRDPISVTAVLGHFEVYLVVYSIPIVYSILQTHQKISNLDFIKVIIFSLNFGLLASYLLGMTHKNFEFEDSFKPSAFVVGFPIIGSILQLLILPFLYDSPDSLGKDSK